MGRNKTTSIEFQKLIIQWYENGTSQNISKNIHISPQYRI